MEKIYPFLLEVRDDGEVWEFKYGYRLYRVHLTEDCKGEHCPLHSPGDHNMRDFTLHWRGDRAMFERMCEHGVGHPDPDWLAREVEAGRTWQGVHGCDGCCGRLDRSNE